MFLSRENDVTWDFLMALLPNGNAYGKMVVYETAHSGDGDLQKRR